MGIIQAKEALSMSLEERMANFMFLYDDEGPRLNPHIMEKLKPELSNEMDQETEYRLSPDLPSLLVDPANDPTASPQSQDGTSTGKKMQAPSTKLQMGEWQKTRKGTISSEEMLHPQVRKTH